MAELDRPVEKRIVNFLRERLVKLDDPRQIGGRLHGPLSRLWKYRVGDYRLICSLEQAKLVMLVLRVGRRSEIYEL